MQELFRALNICKSTLHFITRGCVRSSILCLLWNRVGGAIASQKTPGSSLLLQPRWDTRALLLRRVCSRYGPPLHLKQLHEPPLPLPLNAEEQRLHPTPPLTLMIRVPSPAPPPTSEETYFSHLYLQSRSFCHHPKLLTVDEGRNVAPMVNGELDLLRLTSFFALCSEARQHFGWPELFGNKATTTATNIYNISSSNIPAYIGSGMEIKKFKIVFIQLMLRTFAVYL